MLNLFVFCDGNSTTGRQSSKFSDLAAPQC